MGLILASIVLAVVLALCAGVGFYLSQEPVYEAQPMPSVRVGEPGHNLVGRDWTGNPQPGQSPDASAESAGTQGANVGQGS